MKIKLLNINFTMKKKFWITFYPEYFFLFFFISFWNEEIFSTPNIIRFSKNMVVTTPNTTTLVGHTFYSVCLLRKLSRKNRVRFTAATVCWPLGILKVTCSRSNLLYYSDECITSVLTWYENSNFVGTNGYGFGRKSTFNNHITHISIRIYVYMICQVLTTKLC